MKKQKKAGLVILYFLFGVFVGPNIPFDFYIILISVLLILLLFFLFRANKIVVLFCLAALFLFAGFFRFYFASNDQNIKDLEVYDKKEIKATGYVSSYPNKKGKTQTFYFAVEKIFAEDNWQDFSGKIFILTSKVNSYSYGQNLEIIGKLEKIENTDEFNFREFFLSRGIGAKIIAPEIEKKEGESGSILFRNLYFLREIFEGKTKQIFQEPFATLVLGLLLGVKAIPADLMEKFNRVSISHIIVVSGYNLSVIVNFLRGILEKHSRRLAFWIPFLGMTAFVFFVGAEPPVVRAGLMASVIIFSRKRGRKSNGVFILLLVAFLMVLLNPMILRFDPGFQLSFVSTLGILVFASGFDAFLRKQKMPSFLSELVSSTLSAQVLILPVVLYYFERISLAGPFSNFLILPIIPLIMLLSFLAILLGFASMFLGYFLSLVPVLLMLYLLKVTDFFYVQSWSSINIKIDFIIIPLFYFLILAVYFLLKRIRKNA